MDSDMAISKPHNLSLVEIKKVDVIINSDTDEKFDFIGNGGIIIIDEINFNLHHNVADNFDNSNFSAQSFNRGYIKAHYLRK
jgi:hypothetical protein